MNTGVTWMDLLGSVGGVECRNWISMDVSGKTIQSIV